MSVLGFGAYGLGFQSYRCRVVNSVYPNNPKAPASHLIGAGAKTDAQPPSPRGPGTRFLFRDLWFRVEGSSV